MISIALLNENNPMIFNRIKEIRKPKIPIVVFKKGLKYFCGLLKSFCKPRAAKTGTHNSKITWADDTALNLL